MIFLKKILENIIYSSNVLTRWSFQKKNALEYDLSSMIRKDGISFFPKIYFFYGRKMKDTLSQKIHGNMMFSVCSVKMVFLFPTNMKLPFCQKSKDDLFPKNTPKDGISGITEKDGTHPRKDNIGILERVPMILCAFMETFSSVFNLLFNEKNPGNLIFRIEI